MANGIRVLVADDEPTILQFIEIGLTSEGYTVQTAADGAEATEVAASFRPHVAILDVMMPHKDGFEVCDELKKSGDDIAIIMLTARDDITDRVRGLALGADDYMPKPFSFDELLARIHARLRNQFPQLLGATHFGPFTIDERRNEISYEGSVLELSPTEYSILKLMVAQHGAVISKSFILDKVWGYDFGGDHNIVEVYIRALRDKLGDKSHILIKTLRGAGYRVDLP